MSDKSTSRFSWPAEDLPGRYRIHCSCRRWQFAGTAAEIAAAGRGHDDSPGTRHIVSLAEVLTV